MGHPLFGLARGPPYVVLLEPTPEAALHLPHRGHESLGLFLLITRIERVSDQQVVRQLRRMIRREPRGVEPIRMIADEQACIRMPLGEAGHPQPPSLHARHWVGHNLAQPLGQPVFG